MPDWLTYVAAFGAFLGPVGLGALLKIWLDHKRGKRKQTDDVALGFADRFEERVEKVEASLVQERARCDAELGVHRHEIVGLWQLLYSLLHLFDVPAGKRKEMLASIHLDIAALKHATAHEKATIAAAGLKEPQA